MPKSWFRLPSKQERRRRFRHPACFIMALLLLDFLYMELADIDPPDWYPLFLAGAMLLLTLWVERGNLDKERP